MYAISNSHFKGLRTVMARLRSLIIPNLMSPQSQINCSPDHQTPSCDYTHDSLSSTIYTRVTNLKQYMHMYAMQVHTHKYTHICTWTHTCTHVHTQHSHSHDVHINLASNCVWSHFCPISRAVTALEKRQGRQHHYTTPIQTQLTTQVWTSLIFLHHTATNLLKVIGS